MILSPDGKILKGVSPLDVRENTLIIPSGVEKVASRAIVDLPTLKNLIIPESLEAFDMDAINNTGIVHLVIPETVKRVADQAFAHNEWLTIVEFKSPETKFNGTALFDCRSLNFCKVGAIKYNVRCLKFGVCYQILSKHMFDIYTIYLVEPFKESTNIGKLYVALKQGVCGDGTTVARAIEDCHNNYMTPDIVQQYKDISLDALVGWYDYKRITGACDEGIVKWMKEKGFKENDKISVRELLKLLGNSYGSSTFIQFIADRYKDRMEEKDGKKTN